MQVKFWYVVDIFAINKAEQFVAPEPSASRVIGQRFQLNISSPKTELFVIQNVYSEYAFYHTKIQLLSALFSLTNSTHKHTLLMLLTVTSHDLETQLTSF